ncbi:UL16-binding protein 1 isoform X1 [Fukomys damarensis]|uniref:UL16-binding protein 1 isoform X1 n=1 Tax=Fukomys damarensis TaxID=885580 RepID=UPI00053FE40D|nr:UL16-binding protein 1 isoform X1 [Fukomys damarensis]XP_010618161.1 UL16-binding protein 1 isoform X1 [Fukomys damarensis]
MVPAATLTVIFIFLDRSPLSEPLWAAGADMHSLFYNFIINPKAQPGDQWCKIRGQVDQKTFLFYNCVNAKAKSISILGGKIDSTKTWEEQTETLRDLGNMLKQELLDIKLENCAATAPAILWANLTCHGRAGEPPSGSWELGFNGQILFHIESNKRKWTEVNPGSSCIKKKWEKNRELTQFLYRTSTDDCGSWFEEFMEHWKEILETRAPPTTPAIAESRSKTAIQSPRAQLILTCSVLLSILGTLS